METHWISLYVNSNNMAYFESSGLEHVLKEIKNVIHNRLHGYFFLFIDFTLKCKSVLEYNFRY